METAEDLEGLVLAHETTLYRAALALLGDVHEAEDAVQDAFLKYLEKRPALAGEDHARAWLLRVTINGCKSRLRAPWRRRRVPMPDLLPAAPEEREALEEIYALPPRDRAAVHLFYYEGYKTAEIAAMTGEAEGTVRARLSRARKKLRKLLEGEEL